MTNRILPTAKSLFAAALAASALVGLNACGSSDTKPAAAAASAPQTTATAPASVPNTTQSPAAPAAPSTTGSQAAGADSTQSGNSTPSDNSTQSGDDKSGQTTDASAPAPKPTKPASHPSPSADSSSDPSLPGACSVDHLKGTVTKLNSPINHVLLTVTNTGGSACDVYYYPDLKLDADQQAVTQVVEDSQPQAVVTLDPGASAYASIGTSAADGSGGTPKLEKQVEVYLQTRDQSGSLPGSMTLPLPAGTYVDEKAFVTYWQSDLQSATAW